MKQGYSKTFLFSVRHNTVFLCTSKVCAGRQHRRWDAELCGQLVCVPAPNFHMMNRADVDGCVWCWCPQQSRSTFNHRLQARGLNSVRCGGVWGRGRQGCGAASGRGAVGPVPWRSDPLDSSWYSLDISLDFCQLNSESKPSTYCA